VQPREFRSAEIGNRARELPKIAGILYHLKGKSRQLVRQAGAQPNKHGRGRCGAGTLPANSESKRSRTQTGTASGRGGFLAARLLA